MTSVTAFGSNGRSASAAAMFNSSIESVVTSRAPGGGSRCACERSVRRLRQEEHVMARAPAFLDAFGCGADTARPLPARRPESQPPARIAPASAHARPPGERRSTSTELFRERRHRQGEKRAPAHREDVVQRVNGRNATERPRSSTSGKKSTVKTSPDRRQSVDRGVVGRSRPTRRSSASPGTPGGSRGDHGVLRNPPPARACGARHVHSALYAEGIRARRTGTRQAEIHPLLLSPTQRPAASAAAFFSGERCSPAGPSLAPSPRPCWPAGE